MEGQEEVGQEASNLAALAGAAAAVDADAAADEFGPAPGGAVPAGPDPVDEARAVFGMVVGMLSPLLPYLPSIYTDDALARLAAAYVPVAEKYGWSMGGMLDQYGAEIMLAGVALPLVVQTRNVHVAWAAERAARERPGQLAAPESQVERAQQPAAQGVQFGTAQPVEAPA